jgi:hypothetical protein
VISLGNLTFKKKNGGDMRCTFRIDCPNQATKRVKVPDPAQEKMAATIINIKVCERHLDQAIKLAEQFGQPIVEYLY